MRLYDDPVEVRRGETDGPDQFLWRGRLWKVRAVVAHWVETAPWWQPATVQSMGTSTGNDPAGGHDPGGEQEPRGSVDLLGEREFWRVVAGRGMAAATGPGLDVVQSTGVFDLSFSSAEGRWQLVGCAD